MFNAKISEEQDTGILTISGGWSHEAGEELKHFLMAVVSRYHKIKVRFAEWSQDLGNLSCLQLLCAANKSALQQGKSFLVSLPGEGSADFFKLLELAGFLYGGETQVHQNGYESRGFAVEEAK